MARLESQKKMGYYPTPQNTLEHIINKLSFSTGAVIIDPCCGEGIALNAMKAKTFGIEPDTQRAEKACDNLEKVICGSIFEAIIRPLECFSMLYLNPPYDWQDGERMEYLFLKQSHKWLKQGGVLVYVVPEYVIEVKKIQSWISRHYEDIRICKFTREDYPAFRQVALFAQKKETEKEEFPYPPYPHIEDTDFSFTVPDGENPLVFELEGIRPEDINSYTKTAEKNILETLNGVQSSTSQVLSPLFPLRRGHLVSLLMSGVLNGELKDGMVFKCFTERRQSTRIEEEAGKEITTDTYVSGIRVIERGRWYDVL